MKTRVWLMLCFLIAALLRLCVFLHADHLDGDSVFVITSCYNNSLHPFNLSGIYGFLTSGCGYQSGYHFLNSLFMHFIDQPVWVAKGISYFFGILTIIPYYWLIKLAFNEEIALASVFALAFYSVHIQLSAVSLANSGSIFFIIFAVYFFIRYLYGNNYKDKSINFVAAIVFTLLATTFRMDAWFFVFIIPICLLKERRFKDAVLFFVFSSLYILSVICYVYKTGHHPLSFLQSPLFNLIKPRFFSLMAINSEMPVYGKYQIFIWFNTLFHTLSLPFSLFGFLGSFLAFKDKKQFIFSLSFWLLFVFFTARQVISNASPWAYYSSIFVIFFIPFIFLGIIRVFAFIARFFRVKHPFQMRLRVISICSATIYFIFFSMFLLKKEQKNMKFCVLPSKLVSWGRNNIFLGDLVFFSFNTVDFAPLQAQEKLILEFYDSKKLIFNKELNSRFGQAMLSQLGDFVQQCHKGLPGEPFYIFFLAKRGGGQRIERVTFILNEHDYNFLKNNFPDLFEKIINLKYEGLFYSGILNPEL